jgi:hypothetical protein
LLSIMINYVFLGSGLKKCPQIQKSAAIYSSFNQDYWVQ